MDRRARRIEFEASVHRYVERERYRTLSHRLRAVMNQACNLSKVRRWSILLTFEKLMDAQPTGCAAPARLLCAHRARLLLHLVSARSIADAELQRADAAGGLDHALCTRGVDVSIRKPCHGLADLESDNQT